MKKLSVRDHELYKSVSNAKFFNNGASLLYKVTRMSLKENKNIADLYVYDFKKGLSSKLTTDQKTTNYLKYDEQTILVQRKDSDKTYVNKIDIATGEESEFFVIDYKVEKLLKITEKVFIFSTKYNTLYDRTEFKVENYDDGTPKSALLADYYFFDDVKFRNNGEGIINGIRTRLYLYDVNSATSTLISNANMNVGTFDFNNEQIVFSQVDTNNPMASTMSLYKYNINTKQTESILNSGTYNISSLHCLPSGVIFTGYDLRHTHARENAQLYRLKDGTVKNIYNNTMDINKSGGSDTKLATGNKYLKADNKLFLTLCDNSIERLASIDIDGNIEYLTTGFDCITGFDIYNNKIILEQITDICLSEIYLYNTKAIQLTNHNNYLAEKAISPIEVIKFNSNGHEIKGYVIKPTNFNKNKKYPGVLFMHGGPRGLYGKVYQHRMQVLANEGYFCFFTNPHGSASRGNEFSSIFGKHGEIDYEDLMVFTDKVLEQYSQLDADKLGVTGHSYGGIMTNHIITKTNRFKAAVSSASLSNFTTKAFGTDNGLGCSMQVYGDPIDNPEWTWNHSPLKHSKNVTTPTLFLHSDEDYRCLYIEAVQMYTAFKRYGVDTAMYLFKGEAHSLKKPRNKVKWLEVLLSWFNKYLKN